MFKKLCTMCTKTALPVFLFCFLYLSACTTPMHKATQSIQLGMEKDQVLERLGSPQRTRRYRGQDEWTYIYYKDDQRQGTRVNFKHGKVVFVGKEPFEPSLDQQMKDAPDIKEYERLAKEKNKQNDKQFKELSKEEKQK